MRTPITYYGGKQRIAPEIISMLPAHKVYVEPFFGGGAVFFRKPKAGIEVINDHSTLPEPIRKDIDNEIGKNQKAQAEENIRENVSLRFLKKAETYWSSLDLEIKKKEIEEQQKSLYDQPVLGERYIDESDKFCMTT